MKIRLLLKSGTWQWCFPQAGSDSGWSEWEDVSKFLIIKYLTDGWDYERVDA